jgi:hypothetical protein
MINAVEVLLVARREEFDIHVRYIDNISYLLSLGNNIVEHRFLITYCCISSRKKSQHIAARAYLSPMYYDFHTEMGFFLQ